MAKSSQEDKGLKRFFSLTPYKRVIELAQTPGQDEFVKNSLLVTGTVVAAGLVGYIIFTVMGFIPM